MIRSKKLRPSGKASRKPKIHALRSRRKNDICSRKFPPSSIASLSALRCQTGQHTSTLVTTRFYQLNGVRTNICVKGRVGWAPKRFSPYALEPVRISFSIPEKTTRSRVGRSEVLILLHVACQLLFYKTQSFDRAMRKTLRSLDSASAIPLRVWVEKTYCFARVLFSAWVCATTQLAQTTSS